MNSPYHEPQVNQPLTGNDLFGKSRFLKKGKALNEQWELLSYFCEKMNPKRVQDGYKALTPKGLAGILKRVYHTQYANRELYYIKSVCEDAEKRGFSFSKRFWWLVGQGKID